MQHTRWEEHYRTGNTPWDTRQTPPEVISFWTERSSPRHGSPRQGLALDLGCGPATNVAYLASLGLVAIGVDYVWQALETGRRRLVEHSPNRLAQIQLLQADVTQLPLRNANAVYILDIGCSHSLPPDLRPAYAAGVVENLAPGGFYHLFAFDRVAELADDPERWYRGMTDHEVVERFTPQLQVVEILRARPDRYPCRWYLLRKAP